MAVAHQTTVCLLNEKGCPQEDVRSVSDLALRIHERGGFRRCTWREGTQEDLSARFALRRVIAAGVPQREQELLELLIEWRDDEAEPANYFLVSLPGPRTKKQLIRPEIQEAELKEPRNLYLLAEVSGVPAGFALLCDGAREQCVQAEGPLNLSRLYVDRPFLGAKVGAALLLRCLEEGRNRGHDVLWLGVWERNARARAFYSRWGFTEVGEMRFVLRRDPQRDLVLALPL